MMRFTPRLLLALVMLQLWGCAFERKVSMKCKGDCAFEMSSDAEAVEPGAELRNRK